LHHLKTPSSFLGALSGDEPTNWNLDSGTAVAKRLKRIVERRALCCEARVILGEDNIARAQKYRTPAQSLAAQWNPSRLFSP